MDQYMIYICLIVTLSFVCSLGFTIVGLCYSWMKLKKLELEIWRDKK